MTFILELFKEETNSKREIVRINVVDTVMARGMNSAWFEIMIFYSC